MEVHVEFDDENMQFRFLGYEVWVAYRNSFGDDLEKAVKRAIMNTFRGSSKPIEADLEETTRAALSAMRSHPDFAAWEVMNA